MSLAISMVNTLEGCNIITWEGERDQTTRRVPADRHDVTGSESMRDRHLCTIVHLFFTPPFPSKTAAPSSCPICQASFEIGKESLVE